jgi:hypothetical protein
MVAGRTAAETRRNTAAAHDAVRGRRRGKDKR